MAKVLVAQGVHPAAQGVQNLPQEDKPFKCPVIGCEKAYKNQNGLKYHKSVSVPPLRVYKCQIITVLSAWTHQPTAFCQSGWNILYRQSRDVGAVPWHLRHGEREALSM